MDRYSVTTPPSSDEQRNFSACFAVGQTTSDWVYQTCVVLVTLGNRWPVYHSSRVSLIESVEAVLKEDGLLCYHVYMKEMCT